MTNALNHPTTRNYFDAPPRSVEIIYPNNDRVGRKYDLRRPPE